MTPGTGLEWGAALRVGVVNGLSSSTSGGGHTFVESVASAIAACASDHEFLFVPLTDDDGAARGNGPVGPVRRASQRFGVRRLIAAAARRAGLRLGTDVPSSQQLTEDFIRTANIDVVWFLSSKDAFPASVPFIATVWDLQHRLQPFFPEVGAPMDWAQRERHFGSCLPRASRIVVGTQTGKEEVVAFYGVAPENVVVAPLPVADPESTPADEAPVDVRVKYGIEKDFLFYPAQFWPHKNHVNLLLALDHLNRNEGVALDLVLTGSDKGNLAYVTKVIAELGLASRVHILGFVPNADIRGFYRAAVGLAFASFFGPDNIPPLEAFRLNCPVVAARVGGAEEQLGNAALFFDPADPADIARAILAVHRDDIVRAQLIQNGKQIVLDRSPDAYVRQICGVLDDFARVRRCWGRDYSSSA